MITNVAAAVLYVGDQDEALAFYRDILGFDLVTDADRTIDVCAPWGRTSIQRAPPPMSASVTSSNPRVSR